MNQKNKIIQENNYRNLLDINSKKYRNVVKIWGRVSLDHVLVMTQICWKLLNEYGMEFYTECVFYNQSRCDIFAFKGNLAVIIEILHSESDTKLEKKKDYYPDIPLIKIKTKNFKIEEFKI